MGRGPEPTAIWRREVWRNHLLGIPTLGLRFVYLKGSTSRAVDTAVPEKLDLSSEGAGASSMRSLVLLSFRVLGTALRDRPAWKALPALHVSQAIS